jgi:hypothetical protein
LKLLDEVLKCREPEPYSLGPGIIPDLGPHSLEPAALVISFEYTPILSIDIIVETQQMPQVGLFTRYDLVIA